MVIPTKVVSDNFKSFKSNETEVYFKEIMLYTWKPILEKSLWWGMLIATLKSTLWKIVGSAKLKY